MKNMFRVLFFGVFLMGCSADDTTSTPTSATDDDDVVVPTPTLSELQDETMDLLTDKGEPKVWKVKSAKLTNGNATLDISSNFNVVDDEVVFYEDVSNNMIEWRRGHDIETAASTAEETLLDYYRSSISSALSFDAESSTNLTSSEFDIEVSENNTVTLKFGGSKTAKNSSSSAKNNDGELVIELEVKQPSDYKVAPDNLNFTEAFTFESGTVQSYAAGMIGSYSDNSFFFVTREASDQHTDYLPVGNPERVIRFDLDNDSQSEYANVDVADRDFVSKQLHIVNNQLISIGGTKISTYDFDLSEPTTVNYTEGLVSQQYAGDIAFTRFGMAVQDDYAYIIGGAFDTGKNTPDGQEFAIHENRTVYKYDLNAQTLTYFATLPEARYGARGTIVDDKMYVIGGSTNWKDHSTKTNTIFILNMNDPDDIQTLNMPEAIGATFVQKDQNLIYVTGHTRADDEDYIWEDTTFWVFDTLENSFEEITHNLTNPNGGYAVHQMTIFNGKMYVLFGDSDESLEYENYPGFTPHEEWTIYSADLE